MALQTMYPGINNSPKTTTASSVVSTDTSITLTDASVLPEAPNIAVIGSNAQAEVVIYSGKNGNILTGLVRGAGGTVARSWSEDTVVARNFTLLDYKTLCDNITDLDTRKRNASDSINIETEVTGTLAEGNGGTGQTTLAGVKTWLGLAAMAFKAIVDLASDVTGVLPIGNGGTGSATASVNRIFAGPSSGSSAAAPSFRALVADDIPSLAAGKITSGTLGADRIPSLDASKITSGTLGTDRIPSLNASKITAGTLGTDRIPSLAAGKITSGTFDAARIPTLTYSKISGATAIVQRPNYTVSSTDPGANSTLANGTIYFVI